MNKTQILKEPGLSKVTQIVSEPQILKEPKISKKT
jgi:hypothetical protein